MLKYRYKQSPGVVPEKNVFLEISQNSKENTCARVVFLIKVTGLRLFSVNFAKFLRTSSVTEHLQWQRLKIFIFSVFCDDSAVVFISRIFSSSKFPLTQLQPVYVHWFLT